MSTLIPANLLLETVEHDALPWPLVLVAPCQDCGAGLGMDCDTDCTSAMDRMAAEGPDDRADCAGCRTEVSTWDGTWHCPHGWPLCQDCAPGECRDCFLDLRHDG